MDVVKLFYADISKLARYPQELERELIKRAQTGNEKAANMLISGNMKFVVKAVKMLTTSVPFMDAVQVGAMGLKRAIQGFDLKADNKFLTYAVWWIRAAIVQESRVMYGTMRMPHNVVEMQYRIYRQLQDGLTVNQALEKIHEKQLQKLLLDGYSYDDAWRKLKLSDIASQFERNEQIYNVLNIDELISEDGDSTMGEFLPGEDPDVIDRLDHLDNVMMVDKGLSILTPREREVICLYHGLHGADAMGILEVGRVLGVTASRVQQIRQSAYKKMRLKVD